jgi:protocatechuate 3,4-dioxygenase beta subunit
MNITRRELLFRGSVLGVGAALVPLAAAFDGPTGQPVPSDVGWQTVLVPEGEPGVPLVASGRVFLPDGRPAEGVVLYAYNTDIAGLYTKLPEPNGPEHPRLSGWVKPDRTGLYRFRTIKPGAYPGGRIAAHIHMRAVSLEFDWIDEFQFAGDALLTDKDRFISTTLVSKYGPSYASIVQPQLGADGTLRVHRDIRLARR